VLFNVNHEVERKELLCIVGTSGSGKSTLLNIIGGLDRDYAGQVNVDGKRYSTLSDGELSTLRNHRIGFIFQSFNLLDHLTCWENVALPAYFDRKRRKDLREQAAKVLRKVGLDKKVDITPANLSGGQKQRVAIARALFNDPILLLCDEPTGNLDSETGQQIIQMFRDLNAEYGITCILVTHEDRVSRVAHRVIRLEDGRILGPVESKGTEPVTEKKAVEKGREKDPEKDSEKDPEKDPKKSGEQEEVSG
jgi:ABC-type lipoprotein export system ATPase subunit